MKSDIGVIGLAVMGQNLVLNIESKGFRVSVFNRTESRTKEFIAQRAANKNIVATYSIEQFVASLSKPRKIMLMVQAGHAVDAVIDSLVPLLESGDIIIDGGNSHYTDTDNRIERLKPYGIHYLGTGISGGEYGALHGPSIMPGGHREAYDMVAPIFDRTAAQTNDGPCSTYIGATSSGHFVKMVHNGIEYGIMQIIAETYHFMHQYMQLSNDDMQQAFETWNQGELESYLFEITADILSRTDEETGNPLVEMILDRAQQKGTGKWTSQSAFDFGIPVPTITAAVDARILSSFKDKRLEAETILSGPEPIALSSSEDLLPTLQKAVFLSVISSYAQGMHLLQAASAEKDYNLNLSDIARIWKDGCIIRAALLDPIQDVYRSNPSLTNLLVSPLFAPRVQENLPHLRTIVSHAVLAGIPVPALQASLAYVDSWRTARLPANIIQAQRDYFGAHTYERIDKPGSFHTEWQDIHNIM